MAPKYTIEAGARCLLKNLVSDSRLRIDPEILAACDKVQYRGPSDPWLPTPFKYTEASSAFNALAAAGAALIAKERYGIEQEVVINTDKAALNLYGFFHVRVDGQFIVKSSPAFVENSKEADMYDASKPIHWCGINHHKTMDGRFYLPQTAFNPHPVMNLLGVEEQDVTPAEALKLFEDKVIRWDSDTLDRVLNEGYRQAGTICWTPEEFLNETEHGKIVNKEAIAMVNQLKAPRKSWPTPTKDGTFRPLEGIRVLDVSRAIAAPIISKILAALGADVIHVSCLQLPDVPICMCDAQNGKRDVHINLKTEDGKRQLRKLLKDADVFVDGFRPGALEKLGFDAASCRAENPSLIYVRECCYGYNGPWAHRSGWQNIADACSGVCMVMGRWLGIGDEPVQPTGPIADYGTGFLGAALVVNALWQRAHTDITFDIKVSLVHFDVWICKYGQYSDEQKKTLRELHPAFHARHNTSFFLIGGLAWDSVHKIRPGFTDRPDLYSSLSGKLWGEERDLQVVAPPFEFSTSEIGFRYPSGRRGWCQDYNWLPRPT
ncbi:hypothetical protein H2204_013050 [Knufia peltigerae]|uniref:Uncharacterized protein n=1 Tax=Knufia peltigerae TaxID=1002370 RepID=A0AA38XS30_9EURO|nr:hypothetical protein H2204_013050 [Knufia peltigerae]